MNQRIWAWFLAVLQLHPSMQTSMAGAYRLGLVRWGASECGADWECAREQRELLRDLDNAPGLRAVWLGAEHPQAGSLPSPYTDGTHAPGCQIDFPPTPKRTHWIVSGHPTEAAGGFRLKVGEVYRAWAYVDASRGQEFSWDCRSPMDWIEKPPLTLESSTSQAHLSDLHWAQRRFPLLVQQAQVDSLLVLQWERPEPWQLFLYTPTVGWDSVARTQIPQLIDRHRRLNASSKVPPPVAPGPMSTLELGAPPERGLSPRSALAFGILGAVALALVLGAAASRSSGSEHGMLRVQVNR